jgi:hypothetical protein
LGYSHHSAGRYSLSGDPENVEPHEMEKDGNILDGVDVGGVPLEKV